MWGYDTSSPTYTYKGYSYHPEEEASEDNCKTYHEVFAGDVRSRSIPLSPYSYSTRELFERWIDMGQPTREQLGGQQIEDHEKYYQKWVSEQLEKEFDL